MSTTDSARKEFFNFLVWAVLFMASAGYCVYRVLLLERIEVTTGYVSPEYQKLTARAGAGKSSSYVVDYAFQVDGKTFVGNGSISQPPSATTDVFFDPKNPEENWPERPGAWLYLIITAVLAVLSLVTGLDWRKARRREALAGLAPGTSACGHPDHPGPQ